MGTTRQIFTGDKSQLEAAYKDLAREVVSLEGKVQRLSTASQRAGQAAVGGQREANTLLSTGMQRVAGLAASYLTLQTVLQGVNAELREKLELEAKAGDTQIAVAGGQAAVVRSMAGYSSQERQQFMEEAKKIAHRNRFPDLAAFLAAGAEGLDAGGTPRGVLSALDVASRVTGDKAADLDPYVGALVDLQRATGREDAESAMGFMLSAAAEARVSGLKRTAINLAPAITSAVGTVTGDKEQAAIDAAALFSALGQAGGDTRGESTRTAVQSLSVQLRDFFTRGKEMTIGGRKFTIKPPEDPGSIRGRIEALQADPALARRFMDQMSVERQFQVPVEQLVQGGTLTDKLFEQGLKEIEFDRDEFLKTARDLKALTPELALAHGRQAATAITEQHELAMTPEARADQARRMRDEALARTRQYSRVPPGLRQAYDLSYNALFDFFATPEEVPSDAIRELEKRQNRIVYGAQSRIPQLGETRLTPAEQRDWQFLQEQINALRDLIAKQQELAERAAAAAERSANANEQMNARESQRQPSAAPAAVAEPGRHRER